MAKEEFVESTKTYRKPLIPKGLLPSFLAEAFAELYEDDGLVVLGKGLGWLNLLTSFVRFYADVEDGHMSIVQEDAALCSAKAPLVLVLGLRESENEAQQTILQTWGCPQEMYPTVLTNESGQGVDRKILYLKGGVFSVTSRILIVDLLTNVLSPQDIDGFLIAHAEDITFDSTEAFIIRIYTTQKRRDNMFIKAFSDSPEILTSGFSRTDKLLRALQVRHIYLYPRFHDSVKAELERNPPVVEELHQSMTPVMKEIQTGLVAAVQACMKELKKMTPLVDWTLSGLSIANCVMSNFYHLVRRQLEKEWFSLSPKVKQLVEDLRTLRSLFVSLTQYDCINFWILINNVKAHSSASKFPSMWLLTPAGELVFRKSKERLYKIKAGIRTVRVENPVSRLVPVLEENPKWSTLKKVLCEIKEQHAGGQGGSGSVLVMTKDARTLRSLKQYLLLGNDRCMARDWCSYLSRHNDRARSLDGGKIPEESRLLIEEEGRVRRLLKSGVSVSQESSSRQLNEIPSYIRKRRRIALEKSRGEEFGGAVELERMSVLDDSIAAAEQATGDDPATGPSLQDTAADALDEMFTTSFPTTPAVIFKTLSSAEGDLASLVLQDTQPEYIVLYDLDISFVRAVETYSGLRPSELPSTKVFFLVYEASSEQKVFLKALEREQSAFEKLIFHKRSMPPPMLHAEGTQEMQHSLATGVVESTYMNGTLPLSMDTRSRNKKGREEKRDIAVDVREFRSVLPSILHQGGMRLAPVTLTVGDFVLSNVHCVERKSISDLFGSFASGRLYTQAESQCKYYKCPSLLIEFDPMKDFCLQNTKELSLDIRIDSVCSKLAILTMHFPKYRILWSKSPHETLHIFRALKSKHGEVDIDRAVEVGRGESEEALIPETDDDEVNEAARDMLLRLPGINMHNARRIMRECDSILSLSQMNRDQLRRIAGPIAGQKLFTFFHSDANAF